MIKRKKQQPMAETPVSPIDALVRKLDLVAHEMEAKYGAGVLPSICTPETAAKWVRVNDALSDAIGNGDYDTVKAKTESLARGWLKMEEEAKASGYLKMVEAWYVTSPQAQGIEYIVVKNRIDAAIVVAQNPSKAACVYALEDIANLIDKASLRIPAKEAKYFKDEAVKAKKSWSEELLNDQVPF